MADGKQQKARSQQPAVNSKLLRRRRSKKIINTQRVKEIAQRSLRFENAVLSVLISGFSAVS